MASISVKTSTNNSKINVSTKSNNASDRTYVINNQSEFYAEQAKTYRDEVVERVNKAEEIINNAEEKALAVESELNTFSQELKENTTIEFNQIVNDEEEKINEIVVNAEEKFNKTVLSAETKVNNLISQTSDIESKIETIEEEVETIQDEVELAHDWAVKMDGKINDEDYSSKYYAAQAETIASQAQTDITTAKENAISAVNSQEATSKINVANTESSVIANINTAKTSAINDIATQEITSKANVQATESTVITNVNTARDNAIISVQNKGNEELEKIAETGIDTKQDKLTALGSTTQPIYVSADGVISTCNTIPTTTSSVTSCSTDAITSGGIYTLLTTIYPIGSTYMTTNSTCPLSAIFGTWELVSSGKALWTGTGSNGNTTISASLPEISYYNSQGVIGKNSTGAISGNTVSSTYRVTTTSSGAAFVQNVRFYASDSNSIYSNTTNTVQPPAYVVNVFRRTA